MNSSFPQALATVARDDGHDIDDLLETLVVVDDVIKNVIFTGPRMELTGRLGKSSFGNFLE